MFVLDVELFVCVRFLIVIEFIKVFLDGYFWEVDRTDVKMYSFVGWGN